jgi:hypothetical protein
MTGLIWFVQVVHYPLFARVGGDGYREYQIEHMRRTGWVVGPAMLAELGSGVALVWLRPAAVSTPSSGWGLACWPWSGSRPRSSRCPRHDAPGRRLGRAGRPGVWWRPTGYGRQPGAPGACWCWRCWRRRWVGEGQCYRHREFRCSTSGRAAHRPPSCCRSGAEHLAPPWPTTDWTKHAAGPGSPVA